ncbi:MAG: MarC family protein [Anaerolineales bacterium]
MDNTLEFGLLAFTSLFTMVNPPGVIPVYIAMTAELSPAQRRDVARKATLVAMLTLMAFALTGQLIFSFFNISVNSLRIVGGVIFFRIGYEMLGAQLSPTKFDAESESAYVTDIAITPLAIPIISGPGAITTAILLFQDSADIAQKGVLFAVIAGIAAITFVVLRSGERIMQTLGDSGNKVMMRLMGLIVMVIAVEFFFAGLRPILRDILMLNA